MSIEKTANYVRVRQADPSLFVKESFRTINIDLSAGIKAVVGRRPGKDGTEVQSYMFDKSRFSVEDAKRWIEDHKNRAEASLIFSRNKRRISVGTVPMSNAAKDTKDLQESLKRSAGMAIAPNKS